MFNFIFFGTPDIANITLKELIKNGFIPSVVVCNPDSPQGRKKIITPPLVKITAEENHIPVLQPEKIDDKFIETIKHLDADFYLVVAYGKILPKELLDIPNFGAVNIHPSLLPKYRGASPIQNAILNGEKETGVTLYVLDEKMDHGPIIAIERSEIKPTDNTRALFDKMFVIGAQMVVKYVPKYLKGEIELRNQNHDEATYTKKFKASDGYIEYDDLIKAKNEGGEIAKIIDCKIRALHLEPGCWTMENNKRMKLLDSELIGGKLILKVVQYEGKNPRTVTSSL